MNSSQLQFWYMLFMVSYYAIYMLVTRTKLSRDVWKNGWIWLLSILFVAADKALFIANGMAGNKCITEEGADFDEFMKALNTVTVYLCKMIASDGEGATKLLECKVEGAENLQIAKTVAKSVICSSLVKENFNLLDLAPDFKTADEGDIYSYGFAFTSGDLDDAVNEIYCKIIYEWLPSANLKRNENIPTVEVYPYDMSEEGFEWEIRIPIEN